MQTQTTLGRRRPLATALLCALLLPGTALAETKKEQELQARIAQLEAQVQALLSAQQQQQATLAQTQTQLDQVKVAQAAPDDGKPKIQSSPILVAGNPGGRFSFGGFVKLDAMLTDTNAGEIADGSARRMFYLPSAIPVGGVDEAHADIDTHAMFSLLVRLRRRGAGPQDPRLPGVRPVRRRHEQPGQPGLDQHPRRDPAPGLRDLGPWLAGQTWSNFQDVAALPDAVDFVGPTEAPPSCARPQVRYTSGPFSVALENPQTLVSGYRSTTRTISDDGSLPDLTARWTTKGDWGHVSVAGIARQLRHDTATTSASDTGYSVSVSGKYNLGKSDDVRYMLTAGRGIGRYVAFGLGADGVLDATGGELDGISVLAGFVSWRHVFNPKLRGNLMFSRAARQRHRLDRLRVTESAQSVHANLIWPVPETGHRRRADLGQPRVESGADGDLRRLHTTVKYSF